MGLLDTYVKLQALKQQQQQEQLQQVHSVLYLADAARKMRDMDTEDRFNTAIGNVSPDITTERPGAGITGMESYDVPDPTRTITETAPKTDEQYYGDLFEAGKTVSPKMALPFMTAKRGAAKERATEAQRRAEDPLVPINFQGQTITGAASKLAPIVGRQETLDQRKTEADRQEEYRRDKLEEDKRHRATIEAIKQSNGGLPKPPKDFRYTADGELEPIPGGKEDTKRRESYAKADKMVKATTANLVTLKKQAEKLKKHPGLGKITGVIGAFPNVPGSEASNAQAILNQLKSRTGLDVLQNMRMMSPTGGALGNVSDAEGRRLETYISALEKTQDKKSMEGALDEIIKYCDDAQSNLSTGFEQTFSDSDKARYSGKKGVTSQPAQATNTPRFKILKVD